MRGIDFGVVVALSVELDAVLKQLPNYEKVIYNQFDTRTYYRSKLTTNAGGSYEIVVTMLPRMGNIDSALAAADMIHVWHPEALLVVGIAGGIDRTYQNFGDILISERIYYYEEQKIENRCITTPPQNYIPRRHVI